MRATVSCLALTVACAVAATSVAQISTPGPAIDVEIYNPADGSNSFCAAPGDTIWAHVHVAPATGGTSSFECDAACGTVQGGPANIATATIDLAFDPARLAFHSAENNPSPGSAAADGLVQLQNLGSGRVGWALAGDWTPDGDTSGTLADPCRMEILDQAGWVLRVAFNVGASGTSQITIRDEPDFPLAFADICGGSAFLSSNGGIDEVLPATIATGGPACPDVEGIIFRNGFETGDTSAWP